MPFSRAQNKETLNRILTEVFEDDEDDGSPGPIRKALKNVVIGVTDIGAMRNEEIEQLTYKSEDTSQTDISLKIYKIGLLQTLKGYIYYQDSISHPLRTMDDWNGLDSEAFNNFRVSTTWMVLSETGIQHAASTAVDGTNPTQGASARPIVGRNPVNDFKRGIKRDIGAYPDLKHDKGWDNWNRSLIAQTRAQDLSEVLDHRYNPSDPIDIALFQEKQKFMYAVFEKHLLSDKGKALVREHHQYGDAQAVYKELCAYAISSTKASMNSRDLLTYITSSRLGDGKWKGGTHAYILHWQDQLRKYQDLIPTNDQFSADVKRTMLENAVSQVPELRAVKVNADLARTQTGKHLTYLQYCALLSSAAQQYDDQFTQSNMKTIKTRHIYNHDMVDYEYEDRSETYDIDMDVTSMVEVNATDFNRGPRLQRSQWDRLGQVSASTQETWDSLSNEAKRIILEPRKPRERPPRAPNKTTVNLHDISAYEYLQIHEHKMGHDQTPNDVNDSIKSDANMTDVTSELGGTTDTREFLQVEIPLQKSLCLTGIL